MKNTDFPISLPDDSVIEELATLSQCGLLSGEDIPDDLLEAVINSDDQ